MIEGLNEWIFMLAIIINISIFTLVPIFCLLFLCRAVYSIDNSLDADISEQYRCAPKIVGVDSKYDCFRDACFRNSDFERKSWKF